MQRIIEEKKERKREKNYERQHYRLLPLTSSATSQIVCGASARTRLSVPPRCTHAALHDEEIVQTTRDVIVEWNASMLHSSIGAPSADESNGTII